MTTDGVTSGGMFITATITRKDVGMGFGRGVQMEARGEADKGASMLARGRFGFWVLGSVEG